MTLRKLYNLFLILCWAGMSSALGFFTFIDGASIASILVWLVGVICLGVGLFMFRVR
jgi:multisubunit Na+/H+ antiporter MnhE subunit